MGSSNQALDPELVDGDFDRTWQQALGYDEPEFSAQAAGMLGYGDIDADEMTTDIWGGRDWDGDGDPNETPSPGLRNTTYYRTTFTPVDAVVHVGFEGLMDDGAIIYLNGVEVERFNVADTKDADDWQTRADGTGAGEPEVWVEARAQYGMALNQNLPAGELVEVAVSLHNASSVSMDMAFDLRIFSVNQVGESVLELVIEPSRRSPPSVTCQYLSVSTWRQVSHPPRPGSVSMQTAWPRLSGRCDFCAVWPAIMILPDMCGLGVPNFL